MVNTNTFSGWSLEQLRERARLNQLRGIAVSEALRNEIRTREASVVIDSVQESWDTMTTPRLMKEAQRLSRLARTNPDAHNKLDALLAYMRMPRPFQR